MPDEPELTKLVEEEEQTFQNLGKLFEGGYEDAEPALVRGVLDGKQVAVVCATVKVSDSETFGFHPIAILLDEETDSRLEIPTEKESEKSAETVGG